jgi:hypothetical protein
VATTSAATCGASLDHTGAGEAGCGAAIDADTAAAFLAGGLPASAARQLERHLDACAECRWLVYAAAAASPTGGGDALTGGTLPPGARLGRYEIQRPLGAGGMGVVYLARDRELDRPVALKAVRAADGDTGAGTGAGADRARAEAQALARIAHPNVVAVYELVEAGARRYVAMEYVEGTTLDRWLAAAAPPRSARAIVDAFAAAGAGLAAVHAAGVVHGDVKPSNVLVGDDGRVRLTDFGLARAAGAAGSPAGGTPAYMAPELHRGAPATAASDQLAFCRALAGALGPRAPRRIRAALARGQADDPAARHPSMTALLRRLAPVRWRGYAVVAAAAVAAALLAIAGVRGARDRAGQAACEAGAADVGATWRDARAGVERALRTAGGGYGADAWAGVARGLDGWIADYRGEVVAACAATWDAGAQSSAELRARLDCLDERARDGRALIAALAHAERATATHAVVAAATLESPRVCGEPGRRPVARPDDAALAARVDAVRAELARIEALELTGATPPPIDAAVAALAAADATAYPPVIAEATLRLGSAQLGTADAAATLMHAATLADRVGHDALRARALVLALRADYETGRADRLEAFSSQAAAALVRSRGSPLAWAELHQAAGVLHVDRGELAAGERELALAIALRTAAGAPGRYLAARSQSSLAISLAKRGELAAALATLRDTARVFEAELGANHPRVAGTHLVIGQVLLADLQPAAALPSLARAATAAAAGDEAAQLASAESSLGFALTALGGPGVALPHHARAVAAWRAILPDHPRIALGLLGEGQARIALADWPGAVAALEAAAAIPARSPDLQAEIRFALAVALTAGGRPPARAIDLAREATALYARPDAAADPRNRRERDRIAAWLAEHAPR